MSMREEAIKLAVAGFFLGMIIGDAITAVFASTDGIVLAAPELSEKYGYVTAVIIQTLLSGVLGAVAFGATIVYHMEKYSILAATGIHMAIAYLTMLPIANILWWTGRTVEGNVIIIVMTLCMYAMIWFSVYMSYRIEIQKINESLERKRSGKE